MRSRTKWIIIGIIYTIILACVLTKADEKESEKGYINAIEEGRYETYQYYTGNSNLDMKEVPKKIAELSYDVEIYNSVSGNLYTDDYTEKIEKLESLNGSYKKYDKFKEDMENLIKKVNEIVEFREKLQKVLDKAKELEKDGEVQQANQSVEEFLADYEEELIEYATYDQQNSIENFKNSEHIQSEEEQQQTEEYDYGSLNAYDPTDNE